MELCRRIKELRKERGGRRDKRGFWGGERLRQREVCGCQEAGMWSAGASIPVRSRKLVELDRGRSKC